MFRNLKRMLDDEKGFATLICALNAFMSALICCQLSEALPKILNATSGWKS
ncbi:MAG: hypothetical protein MASP_01331 [Candidatus Methanolliviera sp. GoM_asphalt]|nr:MAG: hypothetical protein MASP_01331 [Candidatus Methanolliviera sp. GoM_asphalt]